MSFASREKALLSQFEVGVGLVAGGGPMARLPRVMGRGRALEVLLSADDIRAADAERLGYVNRALPDSELDNFVDALNPHRLVRQVGDREHQAPGERSQPAARRRNQGGLGRLHGLRQATSCAGKN
jgi:enoyl-CoA hydratase/carnithine racemase